MAKDFRSSVRALAAEIAEQLAEQLIQLVRTSSMEDVFGTEAVRASAAPSASVSARAVSAGRGGRGKRGRRSAVDTGATLTAIAGLLAKSPEGLRAEQIRAALKIDKPTVTKALTAGLESKKLRKKGEKRATKYFTK
jgi:hypothetical protein